MWVWVQTGQKDSMLLPLMSLLWLNLRVRSIHQINLLDLMEFSDLVYLHQLIAQTRSYLNFTLKDLFQSKSSLCHLCRWIKCWLNKRCNPTGCWWYQLELIGSSRLLCRHCSLHQDWDSCPQLRSQQYHVTRSNLLKILDRVLIKFRRSFSHYQLYRRVLLVKLYLHRPRTSHEQSHILIWWKRLLKAYTRCLHVVKSPSIELSMHHWSYYQWFWFRCSNLVRRFIFAQLRCHIWLQWSSRNRLNWRQCRRYLS